ncbi:MAG: hypothetical protein JW983_02890 [Elusimicrobia bacterium]|nr:hypothetical protein [Elusimicrobiota bacterium]
MRRHHFKFLSSILLTCLLAYLLTCPIHSEVKVTPVAYVSLLGGQYFLEGERDSFAGNFDVFFSPVINFSEDTALLPIYQGIYSGTMDVTELVDGTIMTREVMDNSLTCKFTRKYSDTFKGKAKVGYKVEYLKETEDEEWNDGLFDYNRILAGLEAEKMFKRTNLRIGYDFYIMHYPNYSSLITTYETALDTATYTEISENAGEDVLDYTTHELFIEALYLFSDTFSGKIGYDIAYKYFNDQTIVESDGGFSSDKRNDFVHLLTLGISKELNKVSISLYDSVEYNDSNQNSYDANRTQYNERYYDYFQNDVVPSITFTMAENAKLNFWWDLAYRKYFERPAQDTEGNYKTSKIHQFTNTAGVSFKIPVFRTLSVKTAGSYSDSSSNNKYEASYRYNYNTFNYFGGIDWEY